MSLTKKDPSLRVAANDPHLVSFGGGRLSTAVTIHYIPIGDMTIGSSPACSISLNGSGVRSTHCTIYRSEENEVTLVPEHEARTLIDGIKIAQETNLTQGAIITIGNSHYLRFNNPAEAQMMRSAMGSNERISMPQIDFTQVPQRNSLRSTTSSSNGISGGDSGNGGDDLRQSLEIEKFYETTINPLTTMSKEAVRTSTAATAANAMHAAFKGYNNVTPIDINGLHCPKVFTADLVTVNMPAKDVLGQKYASFAKNLAENHRNEKVVVNNALRNNQANNLRSGDAASSGNGAGSGGGVVGGASLNGAGNYVNIPSTSGYIQNTNTAGTEYLTKVNNTTKNNHTTATSHHQQLTTASAYDRYPKPGSYGGLQIFPMNGINTEMNNGSPQYQQQHQRSSPAPLSQSENERLEDMLKICTEYADRQNQSGNSVTSSPIVQNRIKTNGSLPRDKKSPFYHELSNGGVANSATSGTAPISTSSGYENVRLLGPNRVEINGQLVGAGGGGGSGSGSGSGCGSASASPKLGGSGYENVVLGKYVPQSPRTKIRTTCMSPKKEHSFSSAFGQTPPPPPSSSSSSSQQQSLAQQQRPTPPPKPAYKQTEYEQLIRTFEEKLKLEMQAIVESQQQQLHPNSGCQHTTTVTPKRSNKNINNLTLNLHSQPSSLQNSPKPSRKPAPAPRTNLAKAGSAGSVVKIVEQKCEDIDQLQRTRKSQLARIEALKRSITELQKLENETLRELDMEKALVSAELSAVSDMVGELAREQQSLESKIHRLEAQRNATRVMEENQQAKLKQSIEMKLDQVKKLKALLKQKPNNDCLKEELHSVSDSLENDRKTFEDLEFQYLEEESEWHAYREELHAEESTLVHQLQSRRRELQQLESHEITTHAAGTTDAKSLKNKLIAALNELRAEQQRLKAIECSIADISGQLHINSSDDENDEQAKHRSPASSPLSANVVTGMMSQSLFGSAELLCPKRAADDIMSKSVNENMFYNNRIELPSGGAQATSTPKRAPLQLVEMGDCDDGDVLRRQTTTGDGGGDVRASQGERVKFNLSLGSDDFEVNPLERRVPSQDDIDRICKLTLDAPISIAPKGASTKIFDSIKEIERNRQLLLAQQGHHVIEHERQKMQDLKKRSHDEARAQYLAMLSVSVDGQCEKTAQLEGHELQQKLTEERHTSDTGSADQAQSSTAMTATAANVVASSIVNAQENSSQQRHSQPEYETAHQQLRSSPRPLSEANSELSCDLLGENGGCKSNIELSTTAPMTAATTPALLVDRHSAEPNSSGDDANHNRSSINSATADAISGGSGHSSERKRMLPKHQRPLTRYLPIFSPDLNLRHHIESAGHQITLCPHVFVDAYSCRGYLHKLGATFHGWARRWFVLDRQRIAFIYYADKAERKPRGGAYFSTIDEVYLDHLNASKSGRPHCTFIVKTKKRSYHLQAASDAAARIWIDAIITGAQGNLDY